MRKQKGCIKTRSIPALFLSVTVKCTIVHLSAVSQEKLKCKHVLYVYLTSLEGYILVMDKKGITKKKQGKQIYFEKASPKTRNYRAL